MTISHGWTTAQSNNPAYDVSAADMNNHVLTGLSPLLEEHTASSTATLDFVTGITGSYDDYSFRLVGLRPATDGANLIVTFSTDGGSTWASTTYNWAYTYLLLSTASNGFVSSGSDSAIHLAQANSNSTTRAALSGNMDLFVPGGSTHKPVLFEVAQSNSGDSNMYRYTGGGYWATTTAVNAVRFAFSSGNIAVGTVRLYGMAQ